MFRMLEQVVEGEREKTGKSEASGKQLGAIQQLGQRSHRTSFLWQ